MRWFHRSLRVVVGMAPEVFRRGVARLPFSRFHAVTRSLMRGDEVIGWRGVRIRVDPGEMLGYYVYLFGDFARMEIDYLLELCGPRTVVFDVGANRGWVSLAIARHSADTQIFAFEADPDIARVAEETCALNPQVSARVTICRHAVGETDGLVTFARTEESNSGTGRLSDEAVAAGISVPCRTLDTVCRELNVYPDVVKIDVEGAELSVLRGMKRLMRTRPPRAIVVELHGFYLADFNEFYREIHDLLIGAGYTLHQAGEDEAFRPAGPWASWPSRIHIAARRG